ncbi:MAG: hypothetical protein ABSH22_17555 [Tepidisphaeraceae bacterium]
MAILLLASLNSGCTAIIYPPDKLIDPQPIYLATYTVHSCVLLPAGNVYLDYSYGDWNYAALHHHMPNDAVGALAISQDAAFERRIVMIDPHSGGPLLPDNPVELIRLYADRDKIQHRIDELEKRFQADIKLHRNDGMVMYVGADESEIFVKDPIHYGLTNNCNNLTADTLRALGYRVIGIPITNQFHIEAPP